MYFRHDQPPVSGAVEGRVELGASRIAQSGPRTQSRYQRQAAPTSDVASRTIPVLIWIEGNVPQQRSPQTTPPRLDQTELQFEPRLVAVVRGQKVRIVNSDPVYHNVFSLSSVKRFDIGRRPTGEHVDVSFDQPGEVQVFCDIHPHMAANIYVMPAETVAWIVFDSNEPFELSGLAPGNYRLRIYSPGYREVSRSITVAASETVSLGTIRLEAS
jgi:plastocyanin